MTEIEYLQKQLAEAKVEIFDLTRRLKNAEFLYWQASHAEPKPPQPEAKPSTAQSLTFSDASSQES